MADRRIQEFERLAELADTCLTEAASAVAEVSESSHCARFLLNGDHLPAPPWLNVLHALAAAEEISPPQVVWSIVDYYDGWGPSSGPLHIEIDAPDARRFLETGEQDLHGLLHDCDIEPNVRDFCVAFGGELILILPDVFSISVEAIELFQEELPYDIEFQTPTIAERFSPSHTKQSHSKAMVVSPSALDGKKWLCPVNGAAAVVS